MRRMSSSRCGTMTATRTTYLLRRRSRRRKDANRTPRDRPKQLRRLRKQLRGTPRDRRLPKQLRRSRLPKQLRRSRLPKLKPRPRSRVKQHLVERSSCSPRGKSEGERFSGAERSGAEELCLFLVACLCVCADKSVLSTTVLNVVVARISSGCVSRGSRVQ